MHTDHHDHDHDHEHQDCDHDHHDAHDHEHGHHHHGHHHGHHHHGPGGHHHHAPANFDRAFAIGVFLNVAFVIIEFVYGIYAESLALIADAGHNLSDVFGLLLAWGAARLAAKAPTATRTYGFRRATILASLASAILLVIALVVIVWEAIERLQSPQPIEGFIVIVVAAIGVVINTITAMMFMSGHDDLNIRGAFLHMAADAAISLGVAVSGGIFLLTQWQWLDPVLSLLIAIIIFWGTWGLLRESFNLAMDAIPSHINHQAIRDYFAQIPHVQEVHCFHIWALSTTEVALTTHLVMDTLPNDDTLLKQICHTLEEEHNIQYCTIQFESEMDCPHVQFGQDSTAH